MKNLENIRDLIKFIINFLVSRVIAVDFDIGLTLKHFLI